MTDCKGLNKAFYFHQCFQGCCEPFDFKTISLELHLFFCVIKYIVAGTNPGCLGDCYTGQRTQSLVSKYYFSSFDFLVYFNKNVLKLAINNFTMHLIILKWLRRQKCRQKRKTMRQRDVKARQEIICKCSLFYFDFFMNCSKSLSDVNSLHYLPHLFSSDPFAALTGLQPYRFCS